MRMVARQYRWHCSVGKISSLLAEESSLASDCSSHFSSSCHCPRLESLNLGVELLAQRSPILSTVIATADTRPTHKFPLRGMLWGGLLAGILDGLDAVIYFGIASGARPAGIFRYIAGGLLGLETARRGGSAAALLGLCLHFLIAFGAATTYCLASLFLPALLRRPFLWGPLFGIAVYAFMDFVVIPLSMLPPSGHWSSAAVFTDEILIHIFGIGLPIAWFASRASENEN